MAAWLDTRPADTNLIIISAVRDPLRNSISAFFQNIDNPKHANSERAYYFGPSTDVLSAPASALIAHFRMHVMQPSLRHLEQFAERFGSVIERDAFSLHFDDDGLAWGHFSSGRYAVLHVHRFGSALPALGRMIGFDSIVAVDANVGSEKWYARQYSEFVESFTPSEEELNAFYGSRLARGFFSEGELAKFRSDWQR